MLMKFLTEILKRKDVTGYRLARDLGYPTSMITQWLDAERKQRAFRLDYLTQIRQWSGLSWEELGKLLDREFPPKK